jgi:hypothetical protein
MEPDRPTLPRNGCYDRAPLQNEVWVRTGWFGFHSFNDGTVLKQPKFTKIANPMTKDCQYSRTTADLRCDGCVWQQELEA